MHRPSLLLVVFAVSACQPTPEQREQDRVRAHLEGAFAQLRGTAPAGLDAQQLALRATALRWLREYIDAAQYPRNEVSAQRTPIFIDRFGNRCAMAALIERSGHPALAARLARQDNLAHLRSLRNDAALAGWLLHHGLTLAEAARVQPTYANISVSRVEPTASVFAAGLLGGTLPGSGTPGGFDLLGGPGMRAGVRVLTQTRDACDRCVYRSIAVLLSYARLFQLGYPSVNQLGLLGTFDLLDYGRDHQLYALAEVLGAFDEARAPQLALGAQAGLGFSRRGQTVPWFVEAVLGGLWQSRGVGLRLGLQAGFVW